MGIGPADQATPSKAITRVKSKTQTRTASQGTA